MGKGFDPACLELADYFLTEDPQLQRLRDGLAQHIQDAVEDWIEAEASRLSEALRAPPIEKDHSR